MEKEARDREGVAAAAGGKEHMVQARKAVEEMRLRLAGIVHKRRRRLGMVPEGGGRGGAAYSRPGDWVGDIIKSFPTGERQQK